MPAVALVIKRMRHLLFLIFFLSGLIVADELTIDPPDIWPSDCKPCRPPILPPPPALIYELEKNIIVDLLDPIYVDGVLTTTHGGVLAAPDLRIQAQNITYIRKLDGETPIFTVTCEGNLLIDYQNWVLVGESLYYDFLSHRGYLINGKTGVPPWFVGGKEILLLADGELVIVDGFVTTSEGEVNDLAICSPQISLSCDRIITATDVTFRLYGVPLFWFPKIEYDLNNIGRSPFAVRFGWGGFTGSYLSLLYHFMSWKELDATARLDGFFGKGVGFGIETAYDPARRPTQFFTRNYYAHDIPLDNPERKDRYRFQGSYYDRIFDTTINGVYDFVSDANMAADYNTKDFDLKTAGRTELELRQSHDTWIANLFTTVRVNRFQSINQELPSFQMSLHPFEIPSTGIICQNTFRASYLNYVFSDDVKHSFGTDNRPVKDFAAGRFFVHPFLYRPFYAGPLTITPEAGFIGIAYSDSPEKKAVGQALGEFGIKLETALSKCTEGWKHVAEPYLHYHFLTSPRVAVDSYFVFNIYDGWDRLNLIRFGLRNGFFTKAPYGVARPFWIDIWANAFIATRNVPSVIPRGYLNLEWQPSPKLFSAIQSGWDFEHGQLEFVNWRADWTLNENLALGFEYRHRSKFDWRKADFYNFILDSARSEEALLNSPLSDRRDTLLFRAFYRFDPDWALKLDLRYGCHRERQRPYFEYQIELSRIVFQHWRFTFIFEQREAGNKLSCSLLLDPGPPPRKKFCR